jgi:hypothetical protein
MSLERGRSIAGFIIAGLVLSIFIGAVAYGVALFVKFAGSALSSMYEHGARALGNESSVEYVSVQVGNETVELPRPSNPALSALADLLLKVLHVVANVLAHPATLAVLVAITLIALALMEKRSPAF